MTETKQVITPTPKFSTKIKIKNKTLLMNKKHLVQVHLSRPFLDCGIGYSKC